eukprot:SAG11_NODE_839_length_6916_cov_7.427314_2_plen_408_part_00
MPKNESDPLYQDWLKAPPGGSLADNPLVNNTQRDPSSAWQTKAGEWRLTTFTGRVYHSWDFVRWSSPPNASDGTVMDKPLFPQGECPSFFPLPKLVPGTEGFAGAAAGALPTHVHKHSSGGDYMQVGTYDEGAENTTGIWTPLAGVGPQRIDAAPGWGLYASKDFHDPVKDRRINWGWLTTTEYGIQSLPRELHYHPQLRQLTFNPVEEQAALRIMPPLASIAGHVLAPHSSVSLDQGQWPNGTASQSEVEVKFKMPPAASATPTEMGIQLMVCDDTRYDPSADHEYDCRKPLLAYIEFAPSTGNESGGSWSVRVGVKPPPPPPPPPAPPGSAPCYNMRMNGTECVFMAKRDIRSAPGDWPVSGGGYLNGSGGARGNAITVGTACCWMLGLPTVTMAQLSFENRKHL